MSMHQGAGTVEELLVVINRLGVDMQKFSDCDNAINEIVVSLDDEGKFSIISD